MNIVNNKLIIISGCSGGGKSTLLSELSNEGYSVVPEVGRELIKEQLAANGSIIPWQQPQAFCEMLITRSIAAFHKAKTITNVRDQLIFFDRSFLEGVSYYQSLEIKNSNKYDHYVDELRYYPTIFMAPPWKEIFRQDEERKHSFESAVEEYERLLKFYPKYGYRIVEFPKASLTDRVHFIISSVLL
jgi:predicted ATPase